MMSKFTVVGASEEKFMANDVKDGVNAEKPSGMSHQEALVYIENTMQEIIKSDSLLRGLPTEVTIEELNSLLALEHGRAITVIINRADSESYSIVVEQMATVMDLKKAIQRHVALKLKREGCGRSISWRYLWKTYWLYFENQKLADNNKALKDYGIRNNSELCFVKRLRNP